MRPIELKRTERRVPEGYPNRHRYPVNCMPTRFGRPKGGVGGRAVPPTSMARRSRHYAIDCQAGGSAEMLSIGRSGVQCRPGPVR
jgi:hypothetical protein